VPGPAAPITLACHSALPATDIFTLTASLSSTPEGLKLGFRLSGDAARLRIPAPQAPGPADNLWRHTCCEAFVAPANEPEYREFNFSPSGQWAVYRFNDYRRRDEAFICPHVPCIDFRPLPDGFFLEATIPADLLPLANTLQIGLTAVIEAADGGKSYWALAHCADQPDFHLRHSFTLTLSHP